MTMRIAAYSLLTAGLLLGALAPGSSARTEESNVWTGTTNGSLIALTYGPLDTTQTPLFLLTCFNEMDVAVLEVFGSIEGMRPGQELTIDLSTGTSQSPLKGEASIDEKTGAMFAEASDIKLEPVLDVLKSPGPLVIKTAATTRTLSDAGRADAVETFSKDCQLD
jgi:hypothetical protein